MKMTKKIKKTKWIAIIFLTLFMVQACNEGNHRNNTDRTAPTPTPTPTPGSESEPERTGYDGQLTLYKVVGGNLAEKTDYAVEGDSLTYQKDTKKHKDIWALVKKIIPQEYLVKINKFVIAFSGGGNAGADGDAYVIQTSDDASTWELGVSIDNVYRDGSIEVGDLGYVITHELAHIITGDESQIDTSVSESNCQEYYPGSGCSKRDSYQNIFYDRFWADIWSDFSPLNVSMSEEEAFYQKYKDRFVSQYAASNPVEDIAETFATFVSEDGITETGVSKNKVEKMYANPKFVKIRDFIRGNIKFNQ